MKLSFVVTALMALALFAPQTAAAQDGRWLRTETPHFIFYSDGSEHDLREAAQSIESFDTILRNLLQPEPSEYVGKLEIYLLRDGRTLRTISPNLTDQIRGFYQATSDLVGAFAIYRDDGAVAAEEVLFHEYTHHFMLANFTNAYPVWYVEGFAEFLQTADIQTQRAVIGNVSAARGPWLVDNRPWMPINDFLTQQGTLQMSPDEGARFYAQSWLAVHYLETNQERRQGFRRYIAALRNGGDPVQSFQPAFGITPDQFQDELHHYARGAIPRFAMALTPISATSLQVTRLPSSADDLLPLVARMRLYVPESERAALATQVESSAARFPSDPFALRARARAAIMRGAPADARPLLTPLAGGESTDVEALYLMGLSYFTEAMGQPNAAPLTAQARHYFAQVVHIDPDNAPALFRYAMSYLVGRSPMPDFAVDVLLKAHMLAPQVADISINAAMTLMYSGDYASAATILRPIAFAPHPDEQTPYLRRLLDAAEHEQRPPARNSDIDH